MAKCPNISQSASLSKTSSSRYVTADVRSDIHSFPCSGKIESHF